MKLYHRPKDKNTKKVMVYCIFPKLEEENDNTISYALRFAFDYYVDGKDESNVHMIVAFKDNQPRKNW